VARGFVVLVAILLIAAICLGTLFRLRGDGPSENDTHEPNNGGDVETGEIIIGVEYVVRGLGEGLRDLGIPAVKPLPESFSWDTMQMSPEAELDFTITDEYVEEYQGHGFTPSCPWSPGGEDGPAQGGLDGTQGPSRYTGR
jgi:hypothetical protein